MKKTILILLSASTLFGYMVEYKCYGRAALVENEKSLPASGYINTDSSISYRGEGDIYIFYPCGAPYVVESTSQDKKKQLNLKRACSNISPFYMAMKTFISDFNDDTTYRISASTRGNDSAKYEERYLVIRNVQNDLHIQGFDEESEYETRIKCTDGTNLELKTVQKATIDIDLSRLPDNKECIFDIYEQSILIGNMNILVEKLENVISDKKDSFVASLAEYTKKTNRKVVFNQKLKEKFNEN